MMNYYNSLSSGLMAELRKGVGDLAASPPNSNSKVASSWLMGCLMLMLLAIGQSALGQTTIISPTGDGGFETGSTLAANNWTGVNGANGGWFFNTAAITNGTSSFTPTGARSLYFSNNSGTNWRYNTSPVAGSSHIYRNVTFPSGETNINLSFRWNAQGETGGWDILYVYLCPQTLTPVANSPSSSTTTTTWTGTGTATLLGSFQLSALTGQTGLISIPAATAGNAAAASNMRLVFTWKNDSGGGAEPPVALDDISLTSAVPTPFSGTYTIDNTLAATSTNYTSFTSFINAINAGVVTGPVLVNVAAGQTFNETPPALTATGTSTNTITFQRNGAGANPKITPTGTALSSGDFGICISGGDYITFDGIDINASAATTSTNAIEFGYLIRNASATNGAQNNTIKNCSITLNKNFVATSLSGCIYSSVSATQGGFTPTNATGANSNNKYYNLTLSNAQNGVYLLGNTGFPDLSNEVGVSGSGCQVARNTITNMGGVSTFTSAYGVFVSGGSGTKIFNNDVSAIRSNQAAGAGILLASYAGTSDVYNNKISDVANSGSTTSTSRAAGIEVQNSTGTPTVRVYNNYVSNITSPFTSTATASIYAYGIYVNNTSTATIAQIDNNNVYLSVASGTPTYSSACFANASGSAVQQVRGNIFVNAFPAQGATARHWCWKATSNTTIGAATSVSNYNDLYVTTDANTSGFVGGGSSTNFSLAAWQTAMTQDANSVSVDPAFTSSTDLATGNGSLSAFSGFTPQSWVTTDIACNDRSAKTPSDLGAFAFDPAAAPTVTSFTPSTICFAGGQTVTITGTTFVGITSVKFNGINATSFTVVSPTSITAVVPSGITDGTITVTNSTGTGTSSSSYTVAPMPTVGVTSAQTICSGGAGVSLTANGASTYSWSPATGLSATTGATVTANPTSTTTYTVTGTSAAGCTATNTVTVTVNPTPSAITVAKSPSSICAGGVTTLTATGGTIGSSGSIAVGTATTTTTAAGIEPTAFNNRYKHYWMQMVFTPAELIAAGFQAGNISAIKFNITTLGDASNVTDLKLRLGNAPAGTLSAFQSTGLTLVKTSATFSYAIGVNTLTFDTPYFWDGASNLILDLRSTGVDTTNNAVTYYTATTGNTVVTAVTSTVFASSDAYAASAPSATTSVKRLNTTFDYSSFVPTTITWSPTTDLYTSAAATTAYTGQNQAVVYSKGSASRTYTATATASGCTVTSNSVTVAPNALPTIFVNSAVICNGDSTTLSASGGSTYTWSPATGLSATSGDTVTANPSVTTLYTITGTDANGCINTTTATVTVNNPVVITSQPSNAAVAEGNDATFTVAATGTGLTYQWEVNTGTGFTPISSATGASYTATAVTNGMSGYLYHVIISGTAPCAPVTSADRSLTVSNVAITSQPANQTICSNGSATFSIGATGVTSYQWQVNTGSGWSDISGQTGSSLVLSGLTSTNTGSMYRVLLNGGAGLGGVNSDPATVTVFDAVVIGTQPSSQAICSNGASVTFSVSATGSGLAYQWRVNSGSGFTNISGATSSTYTINSPAIGLSGNQYQVVVSGTSPCSAQTSTPATLIINQLVAITSQPANVNFCTATQSSTSFTVAASGTGLSYQWVNGDGSPLSGADFSGDTTSTLTVANAALHAGSYKVIVSGTAPCTSVTSSTATLTVVPVMGGVKTVGAGGDFPTLSAAAAAYNSSTCFSGNVVFNLTDTTYSTNETFPITINANANAGAYTLTIKPSSTATITGSSAVAIIKLNGADNVIIDGSNAGGSDKSLTIINTNTGTSSAVVWIASASATDGATGDTIKNTITKGNDGTTTFVGIFAGSGTTMGGVAEVANTNLTVQNNTVIKSQYGIAVAGSATAQTGTTISGNTIGSATAADYVQFRGLFVSNLTGATVNNNSIINIIGTLTNPTGIFIAGGVVNSTFNANKVDGARYTGTSGYGGKGFDINTGSLTSNVVISNNMVSNIGGDGWSSLLGDSTVGIRIGATAGSTTTTGGIKVYNNTVNLSGSFAGNSSGTTSAALYIGSASTTIDVRNNILVSTLDNTATSSDATYAINSAAANTAFSAIDYNDYYVSGTPGTLGFISSARTTLAALQTGFGSNVNSKNIAPNFTSASNLHLLVGSNSALSNLGTPIAGITIDIDGDTRNATTPDMGADEWDVLTCDPLTISGGTASSTVSAFCSTSTGATVSATGYSFGEGTTYQWESSADNSTFTAIGSPSTTYANITTGALSATIYYRLKVVCNAGTAVYSNTVTITKNTPAVTTVSANVSICAGGSTALTANGSSTYAWSPATGLSATIGATVTASPTTTTTYTVTGTDANGCTSTATVTVTVNAYPSAITISQTAGSTCAGSIATLTATGGTIASSGTANAGTQTTTEFGGGMYRNGYGTGDFRHQLLYTKAELNAAGITNASNLTSITFNVTSNGTGSYNNYTISLANTSATALTSTFATGTFSTVYTAATYTPVSGNNLHTFSTPFAWDGMSNVLVNVCYNVSVSSGSATLAASTPSTISNINLLGTTGACTATSGATTYANRPTAVFGYNYSVPTQTVWSPTTDLYTNAGATIPYTGTSTSVVYAKPSVSTTYTASAINAGCSVQSNALTITPIALPEFTLTDVTICKGNTTVLTAAGGVGNSYSWSPATGLSATSGASVTANPTVTTIYTVVATNNTTGCQNTKTVTVTVNNPPVVTMIDPLVNNVAVGQATSFTVSASGDGLTYQWQVDDNLGGGFVNITDDSQYSGANTATLNIASPTYEMYGYQYQAIVSGTAACTTPAVSDPGILNVDLTGITSQPVNATVCASSPASFTTVAASTDPEQEVTYSWEVKVGAADFAPVSDGFNAATGLTFSGSDTGTLSMTGTAASNSGLVFHAIVNGYIFSSNATLTVNPAVNISTQPSAQQICAGSNATFSVNASNVTGYQWEVNSGSGFTPISGATSASLVLTNPAVSASGNLYRVVINGISPCGSTTSTSAALNIINPVVTTQPTASTVLAGTTATFSIVANGATTYTWQSANTINGTYSDVTDGTPAGIIYSGQNTPTLSAATSTATSAGTNVFYRCVVANGVCSSNSNAVGLTVTNYCSSVATNTADEEIFNVTVNGSSTNPAYSGSVNACATVAPGDGSILNRYSNFTSLGSLTSVSQLQNVSFSIVEDECDGATYYSNGCAIWIDFNKDGDFDDAGEKVFVENSTTISPRTISGTFSIPLTASLGTTRMRIIVGEGLSGSTLIPCGTYGYGETEDYNIDITAAPQCTGTPVAGTATSAKSTLCAGGSTSITLNGATSSLGITTQWYSSTDNLTFSPISGATSLTLSTGTLSTTTYYKAVTTCSNSSQSAESNVVTITVNNPLITGSTPAGRCGTGTLTLGATANAGSSINWYAAATGGAILGSGTTFTTPSISATTTYYAEANQGGTTENVGVPAPNVIDGSFITTGWGIVFNATAPFTLTSAVVYPTGTGDITIQLVNSSGTELAVTSPISLSGTGSLSTPAVLPLGFAVPIGTGYRLQVKAYNGITNLLRGSTGVTYPYTSASASVTSGYNGSTTTTNYFFYNLTIGGGCQSARTAVVATVTPQPTATISYAGSPFCSTVSTGAVTLSGTNAYTGGTFTSTSGLVLNGSTGLIDVAASTPGTYTVTYNIPTTGNCSGLTATTSVTINQALSSAFTYGASTYCSNGGTVSPIITGAAGIFTASPAGLSIGATTGAINLAASAAGTYTVTNTVTVAGCSNSVTTFSVTVNQAVAITSQPVSVSKLPTENTSFSVTATGTGLTYQWQVNDGSGFVNVADDAVYSGSNSATLSLTGVTAGMNGYLYQVIVSGASACAPVTSSTATLSVSTAAITAQPANYTACSAGSTSAMFSITTSGDATSFQWQINTGSGWSNLSNSGIYSNVDTNTLILTGVTLADNNSQYRVIVNGTVISNAATLTVNTAVAIGTQPTAAITCAAGTASFTVAATGTGLGYQWQVNTGSGWSNISNGGVYANATTATLNISNATIAMNGYQYQVIVSGASPCSNLTSTPVTLTVNTAVAIGTQPANATICVNGSNTFSVAATGTGLTYQWELNTGSGFSAISGATTSSYAVTGATLAMNGYQYRVVVSGATGCSAATSNAATLTVAQPAAPIISPASANLCPNTIQALTVSNPTVGTVPTILTLGTGTSLTTASTTTSALGPNPMQSYYGGTKQQMLITAAELATLGITNGSVLTSVAFNLSAVESRTLQNYVVKMKNTATTAFASTTFETGATVVRTAANVVPVVGWNTIALNNNFTYTGQSLLIEISYSNNDGGGTGTNRAYYSTTGFVSSLFYRVDNTTAATVDGTTSATASYSQRNNMQLGVLSPNTTWSPTTGLYTNAAATTAYTGGGAATVYVKTGTTTTYTVTNTNSTGCTNSSTVNVSIAPANTLSSITQPATTCAGSPTTFALAGLLASSTSTITYTVNGGSPQTITGVVANASGNATFAVSLAGFTNGQTLAITSIQRTDASPSCTTTISSNNTVVISVQPLVTYYADADGDGFGNASVTQIVCTGQPSGYVTNNTDCDDTNAAIHATFSFYVDADHDGFGVGSLVSVCAVNSTTPPTGYSVNNTDCDDTNAAIHASFSFYVDADHDGYGVGSLVSVCAVNSTTPPTGYSVNNTDCNDSDVSVYQSGLLYIDADGDHWDAGQATVCYGATAPAGYSLTTLGTDCDDTNASITTCSTTSTLNLKMFIQGYYNGTGMVAARYDNLSAAGSPAGNATDVDEVTVELHDGTSLAVAYTVTGMLQTDGTMSLSFPAGAAGNSYYIVLKHRSSLQLWSANPVLISATTSYDFSTGLDQAYTDGSADPMAMLAPGVYGMYTGDLNQDDFIDPADFPFFEADQDNSAINGMYLLSGDMNGDTFVDPADYPVYDGNSYLGLFAQYPQP